MKFILIFGTICCFYCQVQAVLPSLNAISLTDVVQSLEIEPVTGCLNLLSEVSKIPMFAKVLANLPQNDRIALCMSEQKKIQTINEEAEQFGYEAVANGNVFFSEDEFRNRMGYRSHNKKPKKRSLESELEKTLHPPIYYHDNYEEWDYMRVARQTKSVPKTVNINYQQNLEPADDQGLCACCYAYASTALVANFLYITYKQKYSVSEQEFVDCSARPNFPQLTNMGCEYGHFDECAIYLNDKQGINLRQDYPYVGYKQSSCRAVEEKKLLKDYSVEYVPLYSEYDTYLALKEGNAIATAVCVTNHLRYYRSGVLNGPACDCSADCPNHAVVIVGLGYDMKLGIHYWIVRNSWGTAYGDNGHFKIRAFANCACIGWDMGYFKFTKRT